MLNIKKVRPTFNRVVTTNNCYIDDVVTGGVIIKSKGAIKEYQTVVAIGDTVKNVKVGDVVIINPMRYAKPLQKADSVVNNMESHTVKMVYNIPRITIDNIDYLSIFDSDIDYILQEYEELPDTTNLHNLINIKKPIIEV